MIPCPSEIPFSSFFSYDPTQKDEIGNRAHDFVNAMKQDGFIKNKDKYERVIPLLVSTLKEKQSQFPSLSQILNQNMALVPLPGHSQEKDSGTAVRTRSTVAICDELVKNGLGAQVFSTLIRTQSVTKSSTAKASERPKWKEHYQTITVTERMLPMGITSISLVDDVITRGATMVGAYLRIKEAFPSINVTCFALIRADSGHKIVKLTNPAEGMIQIIGEETYRRP